MLVMSGEGVVIAVTLHGGSQRAYRIRWKKRSQICKRRTTRNVVNEYMKTRVAKWSGTRAIRQRILVELVEQEYRSYISEPERGGRKWKDKQAEHRHLREPTSHSRDSR